MSGAAPPAAVRILPFEAVALEAVVALSLRAWEPVFDSIRQGLDPEVFDHFYPDWRAEQAKAVASACTGGAMDVWTASLGDRIVGFVAVRLDRDSRMGEVHMIAVDPAHQRTGIAAVLMQQAMDCMAEAGMSVAMVETGADPGHAPARRVYERMGFRNFPAARYFRKL